MAGNPIATTTAKQANSIATTGEKGTTLGETTIDTTVTEPEFTFGSIDNNRSVITKKLHEVT